MKKQQFDIGTYFTIKYYADKHQKTITRRAKWDEKCRTWVDKKGDQCLCFFDRDATSKNKYRTAVNYEVLA